MTNDQFSDHVKAYIESITSMKPLLEELRIREKRADKKDKEERALDLQSAYEHLPTFMRRVFEGFKLKEGENVEIRDFHAFAIDRTKPAWAKLTVLLNDARPGMDLFQCIINRSSEKYGNIWEVSFTRVDGISY